MIILEKNWNRVNSDAMIINFYKSKEADLSTKKISHLLQFPITQWR
jgi:hypothetical protein